MPFLAKEFLPIPNKDILSWIFDEPRYDQERLIYIDALNPSRSISANQARRLIRQLAAGFRNHGVQPGDCICVHSFNDIYYPILFLGILAVGGVFAGTNPAYTPYELEHHFKTSQTKYIISEPEILPSVLTAARDSGIPNANIWILDVLEDQTVPSGFQSWKSLMTHGERDWVRFDDEQISKSTTAGRLYSSGTTGLPKAAAISHYNLVASHTLVNEAYKRDHEPVRVMYLPMFHAATVPICHTSALREGVATYVMRRFDMVDMLSTIQRYGVNELVLVPPIAIAILKFPQLGDYSLKSIRLVQGGAGKLEKGPQNAIQALLSPSATFTQAWGMTETSCVASRFDFFERDDTGSVGRMITNLDIKLVDDDGNDVTAFDVSGELCIRGPTIIESYFNNPAATAESFDHEGYFKTGDIMYCDSKTKKWYIIDRKKELIKVRAFQVAPAEIEAVLLSHPLIMDAAVIGLKKTDQPDVELPRAYVARIPGTDEAKLTENIIKQFCSTKLAKYKELTGGVRFIDAIPRNAAGKPLKRILREMSKAEEDEIRPKL